MAQGQGAGFHNEVGIGDGCVLLEVFTPRHQFGYIGLGMQGELGHVLQTPVHPLGDGRSYPSHRDSLTGQLFRCKFRFGFRLPDFKEGPHILFGDPIACRRYLGQIDIELPGQAFGNGRSPHFELG